MHENPRQLGLLPLPLLSVTVIAGGSHPTGLVHDELASEG